MVGFYDGFNLEGYIAPAEANKAGERFYDGLGFTYRPATRLEIAKHDAEIRIALRDELTDPTAAVRSEELAGKFVDQHIVSWDMKRSTGEQVPKNLDGINKIHPALFEAVYRMIRGVRLSDPKPDGQIPPSDEDQLKNSQAG